MGNQPSRPEKVYLKTRSVAEYYRAAIKDFNERWDNPISNNATLSQFRLMKHIGSGAFGRVLLCKHNGSGQYYAMKILDKDQIVKTDQVEHIYNEKRVLQACVFPFIVSMSYCFKDNANLFLILECISGGDMFGVLQKVGKFREEQAQMYIVQVVMAFEYLHTMDVMHRDLKPENLLIDAQGFLKLTDMGFAKRTRNRTYTFCGTPDYLAPEIILNKGYTKAVDWWTLGVLLYEFNAGYPPFSPAGAQSLFDVIVQCKYKFPKEFSPELRDLCFQLLQVDLTKRIGNLKNSIQDIKSHVWFDGAQWISIYQKKPNPTYLPPKKNFEAIAVNPASPELKIKTSPKNKFIKEFGEF